MIGTDQTNPAITILTVARKASIMTAGLKLADPRRSMCGRCAGKGFDPKHNGGVRKCQRCRGAGHTTVGNTKR